MKSKSAQNLLLGLALFAPLGYAVYSPTPPATPLSIYGVTLGMSRDEVEAGPLLDETYEENWGWFSQDVHYEVAERHSITPQHALVIHYWRDKVWSVAGDQVQSGNGQTDNLEYLRSTFPSVAVEIPDDGDFCAGYRFEDLCLTASEQMSPPFILEPH